MKFAALPIANLIAGFIALPGRLITPATTVQLLLAHSFSRLPLLHKSIQLPSLLDASLSLGFRV